MLASLYLLHTCGGVVRADVGAYVILSGRNTAEGNPRSARLVFYLTFVEKNSQLVYFRC